jgi:hypothetical protein
MVIGVVGSRHISGPTLQKTFAVLMLVIATITIATNLV